MPELAAARLHLVCGASWRLRDQLVTELLATWAGPVKRASDPKEIDSIILGLDTPSLFEPAACWVIHASEKWMKAATDRLMPLTQGDGSGSMVLVFDRKPRLDRLIKALKANDAVYETSAPSGRDLEPWLIGQLHACEATIDRPSAVAETLIEQHGDDIDGILAALEVVELAAGDDPVTAKTLAAITGAEAAQPIWTFIDAVLSGHTGAALRQVHAGRGLDCHAALGALASELRKSLAALISDDDGEAGQIAGLRGRARLYHARRRARELGRRCLQRLLAGVLHAQRQLRTGGIDQVMVLEMLIFNVERVIRLGGGAQNGRRRSRSAY